MYLARFHHKTFGSDTFHNSDSTVTVVDKRCLKVYILWEALYKLFTNCSCIRVCHEVHAILVRFTTDAEVGVRTVVPCSIR